MKLKNSILVLALAFSVINLNINNLTRYNENKSFISNNNIKQNSRNASSNIPDDKYFSKGEGIITNISTINPRITINENNQYNQYFLNVPSIGDYKPYQYYPSTSSPISSSAKQLTQYPISMLSRNFYIIYKKYEKYPKQLTKDDFDVHYEPIFNGSHRVWITLKNDDVSFCYRSNLVKILDNKTFFNDYILDQIKEKELMPKFIEELNSKYFRYKTAVLDLQEAFNKGYVLKQSIDIDTLFLTPKINKWYQIKYKNLNGNDNILEKDKYLAFKTREEAINVATSNYVRIAKANQQSNYQLKSRNTGLKVEYYYNNVSYLKENHEEVKLYNYSNLYSGNSSSLNMNDIYVLTLPGESDPVAIPVSFTDEILEKSIKEKIYSLDEKEYGVIQCDFTTPYSDRKAEYRANDIYYGENYIINHQIKTTDIFTKTQYYYLSTCFYNRKNYTEEENSLKLYTNNKITDEGIYSFRDYEDHSKIGRNAIIYSSNLSFKTYSSNEQLNNQLLNSAYVYQPLKDSEIIDITFNYFDTFQYKIFKNDEYITTITSKGGYTSNLEIPEDTKYQIDEKAIYKFEVYNRIGDCKTYTINTKEGIALAIDNQSSNNSKLNLNLNDEGKTTDTIYIYEKIDAKESINEDQFHLENNKQISQDELTTYTLVNDGNPKETYTFTRNDKKIRYFYIVINSKIQGVEPITQLVTWYYQEEASISSQIKELSLFEGESKDLSSLGFKFNYGDDKLIYSLSDPSYGSIENNQLIAKKSGELNLIVSATSPNQNKKQIEVRLIIKEKPVINSSLDNDNIIYNDEIINLNERFNVSYNYGEVKYSLNNQDIVSLSSSILKTNGTGEFQLTISANKPKDYPFEIENKVYNFKVINKLNIEFKDKNNSVINPTYDNILNTYLVSKKDTKNQISFNILNDTTDDFKAYLDDKETNFSSILSFGIHHLKVKRKIQFNSIKKEEEYNYKISVLYPDANSITVDFSSSLNNLYKEDKFKYEVSYLPSDSSIETKDYNVEIITGNDLIDLDKANREITCLKEGKVKIRFSLSKNSNIKQEYEFEIFKTPILTTNLKNNIIYVGDEIILDAAINYDTKINYEVDNEKLAKVSDNKLKALKPGEVNLKISSLNKEINISYLIIDELNPTLVNTNDEVISKVSDNNEITIQIPAKLKLNDSSAKITLNGKEYDPNEEISEVGTYEFLITRNIKYNGIEKQERYKYIVIIKEQTDNLSSFKNVWIYVVSALAFIILLVVIMVIIKTKKSSSMKK